VSALCGQSYLVGARRRFRAHSHNTNGVCRAGGRAGGRISLANPGCKLISIVLSHKSEVGACTHFHYTAAAVENGEREKDFLVGARHIM
jgi:hypothetical protein